MEQKDNNPWAEGIKAGPRDSDDFFKKYLYRAAFEICFRYRATSILKPISFVSLSDRIFMIETVSNKFTIIQISQSMNGSHIRKTE